MDMNITSVLHPITHSNGTTILPKACFQMTKKEKELFLKVLENIKFPDECSSNIYRSVQIEQQKIIGLIIYDYHVLMQEFLPIALKESLLEKVIFVASLKNYVQRSSS